MQRSLPSTALTLPKYSRVIVAQPMPDPATMRHIAPWRCYGGMAHSGNKRAPSGRAETTPGRVALSTLPHRPPHTVGQGVLKQLLDLYPGIERKLASLQAEIIERKSHTKSDK